MTTNYDVVVLGAGTAARTVAMRAQAAGKRVAVTDFRPYGGTCALRGCDPKKMLLAGAQVIDAVRRMRGVGIEGECRINWPDLIAFKRTFTDPVPEKQERMYQGKGVDTYDGTARFVDHCHVEVEGERLKGRHFVIATGAEPAKLPIPGAEHLIDNEAFLSLATLPKRILLVGGGYIAAEFSHIAASAGAEVTIVQRGSRMLERFEPELVEWLMDKFKEIGVKVYTGTEVRGVKKRGEEFVVKVGGETPQKELSADLVVHAAGRVPALEKLDLEAADVAAERGLLALNEFLQSTSNTSVYAAGDATGTGPALTPVSAHEGRVVAANILEGNHARPNYEGVPSAAFTIPPIAMAGLTEAQAREQGLRFRVEQARTRDWFTARRVRETVSGYKVLIEERTERILGAHLVGPHADDLINLFALAIRHRLPSRMVKDTMFAYPTAASDAGYML